MFLLEQTCNSPSNVISEFTKTKAIVDGCYVDDDYVSSRMAVYRGKNYLMSQRLQKAFISKKNYFKIDVLEYYYYANKHWKS